MLVFHQWTLINSIKLNVIILDNFVKLSYNCEVEYGLQKTNIFYIIYLFLPARAFPFDPSKVKFSLKIACQDKGLRYQLKNKSKV